MRTSMLKKFTLCFVCLVFALLLFTACGSVEVTWLDADGTILYAASVPANEEIPDKPLPRDTKQWHYTEWREISTDKKEKTFVAGRIEKIGIVWLDDDGDVLYNEYVIDGEEIPEKPLPEDTEAWHYVKWKQTTFGQTVTYVAEKVANHRVTWLDGDGVTVLESILLPEGQEIPEQALPAHSDQWHYIKWEQKENDPYTFIAVRELRHTYYSGNVFQIVTKDLCGNPIATGTGFMINDQGWFMTNAHVMDGAYSGVAYFDIKNVETGETYVSLFIVKGMSIDRDKDIFVGQLAGYNKIKSYYKDIPFRTDYEVGEIAYSVGYPNSSVDMQMNKGVIKSSVGTVHDKIQAGVTYVASDAFIAPGSSGGILVDAEGNILGMTTIAITMNNEKQDFLVGASISSFNLIPHTKDCTYSKLVDIGVFLHPDQETLVRFANAFGKTKDVESKVDEDGNSYYEQIITSKATGKDGFEKEVCFRLYSDGYILYTSEIEWTAGDRRAIIFSGYYSEKDAFDDFSYVLAYAYSETSGYVVASDRINYSENISQTLTYYELSGVGTYYPSAGNVTYAKERFNEVYEFVYNKFKPYM